MVQQRLLSQKLSKKVLLILFSISLVLLIPLLILISLPIFIFRIFIKFVAKLCLKRQILSRCSTLFAQLDSFQAPKSSIVGQLIFNGKVGYEELLEAFSTRVINNKLPNGSLRYPEFQQCLVSRFGFKFWKPVKEFDIRNHIKDIQPENSISEEGVREIAKTCVTKAYDEKLSPWEILLVQNVSPPGSLSSSHVYNTAFVMRLNHSLGDGYSLLQMFLRLCETKVPRKINSKGISKPSWSEYIFFPFKFIYRLAEVLALIPKKDSWKTPDSLKNGQCSIQVSNELKCSSIKMVKNQYDTTFTNVVYTSLAGAIRNISLKKGMDIPSSMTCVLPIPKPGHPDGLCNHFTVTMLELPVGEADSEKRLQICHKNYENLKTSVTPFVTNALALLFGSYFNCMSTLFKNNFCGVTVSYFPVGLDNSEISLNGKDVIDFAFYLGPLNGTSAASISIGSLGETINTTIVADSGLLSDADCAEFLTMINSEVQLLQNSKINKQSFDICNNHLK